jgi:hypothetical protein
LKHYWHVRLMKMEGISLQRRRGNLLEVISGWTGSKSCVHIYKFLVEIALARGGVKGSILDFAALDALEGETYNLQPFIRSSIQSVSLATRRFATL